MDRRHLEQFLAVAEEGSVSAAARRLLLSQPTVSQTIRELETELAAALFRRGRGMVLTPSGRALVGPANQVLRGLAGARAAVEEVTGLLAGELTIAAPSTVYGPPLTALVAGFLEEYPRVHLVIDEAPAGLEAFTLLDQGQIELLIHDASPGNDRYGEVELATSHTVAVFPPTETGLPDRPLGLEDLSGRRTVAGRSPGPEMRPRFLGEFVDAGLPPPEIVVECSDRRTIVGLVLAGAGMTILPETEAQDAIALGAIVRPIEPDYLRTVRLFHRQPDLTPAARAMVELAERD